MVGPPPTRRDRRLAGRKQPTTDPRPWYLAASAAFLLGCIVSGIWFVFGILSVWAAPDEFPRTRLPGSVAVQVTDPGTKFLYYEHRRDAPVASLAEFDVEVTGPDGRRVSAQPTQLTMEYDARSGRLGTAVGKFAAEDVGTYTVNAEAPRSGTALTVGRGVAEPLVALIGSAGAFALGVSASVALTVLARRRP